MELSRGTIADRPWGATLFGFGRRAINGQLIVASGEHRCLMAWRDGAIVGATSGFSADSAARIAVTNQLVTPPQASEITRRLASDKDADEIAVAADVAGLTPSQADKLRRRVIEHRAARTFSFEDATFIVDDQITIPVAVACEVDVRAVIYLGAHKHLAEQRLAIELRQLGSHFTLEPAMFDELYRFGFAEAETPVLQALRASTSVPELETVRELDPRMARAVIYALATCEAVTRITTSRAPTPPAIASLPPDTSPIVFRTPTSPNVARTLTPINLPQPARVPTPPNVTRTPTPAGSGVAFARVPTVRSSSPAIETEPAVDRAPSRPNVGRVASRPAVSRTTTPSIPRTITTPDNRQLAAEAYERGQRAMRAEDLDQAGIELARASDLSPSNVDYAALLGWVRFCLAPDKEAVVVETRKVLEKAIHKSDKPLVARFYLGRVERMVGREREALRHFHEVVEADPAHTAAASEIRILEARLAANSKR